MLRKTREEEIDKMRRNRLKDHKYDNISIGYIPKEPTYDNANLAEQEEIDKNMNDYMEEYSKEDVFQHDDDEWKNQFQKRPAMYPYKKYAFLTLFHCVIIYS